MRIVLSCCLFLVLALATGCAGVALIALGLHSGAVDDAPNLVAPLAPLVRPATPKLSVECPPHLDYTGIADQLGRWQDEASIDLTRFADYGHTSKRMPIIYFEVGNQCVKQGRLPVLVTACIHGNEPLAASVVMGYIGRLLSRYGTDERVTKILDTRDIYFIPVVSPDSYPHSRHVDGCDPNRAWDREPSVPPVAALQGLFRKHKFRAAFSGHTYGRVYLFPWGESNQPSRDDAAFRTLFGAMAKLANYGAKPACQLYGHVIKGSECDWYYKNGACSCVCEMGTASEGGQRPATPQEIKTELDRTWTAFLLFLEQAPVLLAPPRYDRSTLLELFALIPR